MVKKLKCHKKVNQNKDFCLTVMEFQIDNVLQFNQHMKSDKMPYIIYADLETLIKRNIDFQRTLKNIQQQK